MYIYVCVRVLSRTTFIKHPWGVRLAILICEWWNVFWMCHCSNTWRPKFNSHDLQELFWQHSNFWAYCCCMKGHFQTKHLSSQQNRHPWAHDNYCINLIMSSCKIFPKNVHCAISICRICLVNPCPQSHHREFAVDLQVYRLRLQQWWRWSCICIKASCLVALLNSKMSRPVAGSHLWDKMWNKVWQYSAPFAGSLMLGLYDGLR